VKNLPRSRQIGWSGIVTRVTRNPRLTVDARLPRSARAGRPHRAGAPPGAGWLGAQGRSSTRPTPVRMGMAFYRSTTSGSPTSIPSSSSDEDQGRSGHRHGRRHGRDWGLGDKPRHGGCSRTAGQVRLGTPGFLFEEDEGDIRPPEQPVHAGGRGARPGRVRVRMDGLVLAEFLVAGGLFEPGLRPCTTSTAPR